MNEAVAPADIPAHESPFAAAVRRFCLRDHTPPAPGLRASFPSNPVFADLVATGTKAWLDTGDVDAIRKLWCREMTALTTNNTLLNKEVQKGIYDALVPEAAAVLQAEHPEITDDLLVLEIAFILNAVHGLKLVRTFDADVSVELHTRLSRDPEATYRYGKRFHAIEPQRFIVKVPLTPEGLIGARRLRDDGVRVNFTLGFSARQNYLIASLARPDYCNVFMGRDNAFVKDNGWGSGDNVGEKATLASQRVVRELRSKQGVPTQQIGASIRGGQQCLDLLGLDVFTIPTAAAKEYFDLKPTKAQAIDRTGDDPAVVLAAGRDLRASGIAVLWEVPEAFRRAVDGLAFSRNLTGDKIRAHLREHGAGDLFAELSPADRERVTAESKIPKAASWQDRVASRKASWDGMLTEAALASFHQDQTALDDRIRASL